MDEQFGVPQNLKLLADFVANYRMVKPSSLVCTARQAAFAVDSAVPAWLIFRVMHCVIRIGDTVSFTYCLNPEPNSRNMEFDPKQNLFKNLPPLERVTAP